jgi:16S rRNA (cytosine967-C5)-methyltransferase
MLSQPQSKPDIFPTACHGLPPLHDTSEERLRSIRWDAGAPFYRDLGEILGSLEQQRAEKVVERFLRTHRTMTAPQREAVAEAIFGVTLWRRRLQWHLLQTGLPDDANFDGRRLLFAHLVVLGGQPPDQVAHWLQLHPLPALRLGSPETLEGRFSFPTWLAELILAEFGEEFSEGESYAFANALNLPGPVTLRTNTLRISRADLAAQLQAEGVETVPGLYARDALHVQTPRPNILGIRAHQTGLFEVQDEGSQMLGALVKGSPGDEVLDFCAGAGGKTLQLAAMLKGRGVVHAWDTDRTRLERLKHRAIRARATTIRIHDHKPPASLQADWVLVDAPCSELGTLRRGPDRRFRISSEDVQRYPSLQLQILEQAQLHVREGGHLVYGTCTFNRSENENVAESFEQLHPSFIRSGDPLRIYPHTHGTDAFYGVLWRRI